MENNLNQINTQVYRKCQLKISHFQLDRESKAYEACRFKLNERIIICRSAKVTPKKIGQFVTFWKRIDNGSIAPFEASDEFDYFVVNVRTEDCFGQFVFPKSVLITRGIVSNGKNNEGKRAFRVYPNWDFAKSKQAVKTQKWQLDYFYKIDTSVDFIKVAELYGI